MPQPSLPSALAAVALLCLAAMPAHANDTADTSVRDALAPGWLGLYSTDRFRLTTGRCKDCEAPEQALWYFNDDMIAVARANAAGYAPRLRAQEDVRAWLADNHATPRDQPPPLLWIGSPHVAEGRLQPEGQLTRAGHAAPLPVTLTPRLSTNRAYAGDSSIAFFAAGDIKARGVLREDRFVIRTLWPKRYAMAAAPASQPLATGTTVERLVRAEQGGARAGYAVRTLWRRDGGMQPLPLAGKPALAFVLNGAQGDDDESYGGHFAVATGRFGVGGEWDNWLVNNFYSLASVSEKGIIAATLPMDAYMGDLNSGQAWYRPSYMLVAVLKDPRVPALYQEAISRVFSHFYRQDFHYRHASTNCAGINVETLRTLGWQIPRLGGEAPLKAAVALPYMAIKEVSLASGQSAYDYLKTERTELLPFAAFNAIAGDLLQRLSRGGGRTGLEAQLGEDLEALLFVRIPQYPSSRAFGSDPVLSLREYQQRAPANRAEWKIVPVAPRVFPAALKDPAAPREPRPASSRATWVWSGVVLTALAAIAWMIARRRSRSRPPPS
ncbi:hypothetical protein FHW58_000471 [Duganella sp. 1224]|uniref:hypothetical protein n=1 Tax=Duganella sp. 1224 TaxID=2587052 RepID=UPI0017D8491A|nr:hypothetical protein [Duganella sp. 1224]NYE59319.1 hypothetical protein [Duganella sp. 1224]